VLGLLEVRVICGVGGLCLGLVWGGLVVMRVSGLAVWAYCWDLSFDVCWGVMVVGFNEYFRFGCLFVGV